MTALEMFIKLGFTLQTNKSDIMIYSKKSDYLEIYVYFYKDIQQYKVEHMCWIDNERGKSTPMAERRKCLMGTAYYGYWQKQHWEICIELHKAIHQQIIEFRWIN